MTPPPELNLAGLLSRKRLSNDAIGEINDLISNGVNWEAFLGHVKFHRLQRPVSDNVTARFSDTVPEGIKNRLKGLSILNIKKALKHSHGVIKLEEKFRKKGIPVLFYKGVCLSQLLYNDPCARYAGDIDIRIPRSHIKIAEATLTAMGFRRVVPLPGISEVFFEQFVQTNSNAAYISPDNIVVELHWRFCMVKEMFPASFETLWKTKQYVSLHGMDIPTLSDYYTAIVLSLHGSDHAWERLFWLKDLADLYATRPLADMQLFMNAAKKKNVSKQAGETFGLMHHWYDIPVPSHVKILIRQRLGILLGIKTIHAIYGNENKLIRMMLWEYHKLFIYNHRYLISYIRNRMIMRCHKKKMGLNEESLLLNLIKSVLLSGQKTR